MLNAVLACAAFVCIAAQAPSPAPRTQGLVTGAVVDNRGAVIRGAKVSFQSGKRTVTVTASDIGRYEVELPPGTYTVSTDQRGLCPVRRSDVRIREGATVALNLYVLPCGFSDYIVTEGPGKGSWGARSVPEHDDDSFKVRSKRRGSVSLWIRYAKRQQTSGIVRYFSAVTKWPGQTVLVVATYDVLTIQARRAILQRKPLQLCAEGDVVVEDGKETRREPAVVLKFTDGQPVLHSVPSCDLATR